MADVDRTIIEHIDELVAEEQELEGRHRGGALSTAEHERLHAVELQLDQLWDLLRQRRARRNAGLDPDGAEPRDPGTVEDYLQ